MKNFDPALLETLVAFAETGTLVQAANIVRRTPSAITAQMQRLEEQTGVPLFVAAGRNRILTDAGERLVGHARGILAANREAWLGISGAAADGHIGLGMTQDFVDSGLPSTLNQFARTHPRVRIDLRIGRTVELAEDLSAKRIDVLIAMRRTVEQDEVAVIREKMLWLSASDGLVNSPSNELPVGVLDPPCGFREAALKALGAEQRAYRIAATSPSLSGISAAVRAGIAVTVRTSRWIDKSIKVAPKELGLPDLPEAEFSVRVREGSEAAAYLLADVLTDNLQLMV